MSKIKAILFDFDGTLLDTDMMVIRSYLYIFDKYRPDYNLSLKELTSFLGPKLVDVFPKYFKEKFAILLNDFHDYSYAHINYAFLYDGVKDALKLLKNKGYKIGIVTNRYRDSLMRVMQPFINKSIFDVVICLDDVTYSKPAKEPIECALKELNVKKEETIYIGDTKIDVQTGINAEVKTCLVSWSNFKEEIDIPYDYLLNSYHTIFHDLKLSEENLDETH